MNPFGAIRSGGRRLQRAWRSHVTRLAISLILLTFTVLFMADFLGLRGDIDSLQRQSRKIVAEALTVQLSTLASLSDHKAVQYALSEFVQRNEQIVAAGLDTVSGGTLASYGATELLDFHHTGSTATRMRVPILADGRAWGEVRIAFAPVYGNRIDLQYFGFILLGLVVSYFLFLRRALIQLDPSRVVPGRVNTAFEMFSEGVVLLDDQSRILLVNGAGEKILGDTSQNIIGKRLDNWPWQESEQAQPPWTSVLQTGVDIIDLPMHLKGTRRQSLMVTCSMVGEGLQDVRGVMVTLDDVTEIEQKNLELSRSLRKLRDSQESITRKNEELRAQATQDPLTGLLNRRALMLELEREHANMQRNGNTLICLMIDIDHFKRINDTLGHGAGDEVICAVANSLVQQCRRGDVAGRFGGEEFVLVLPATDSIQAGEIVERVLNGIRALGRDVTVPVDSLSASIGYAEHPGDDTDLVAFLDMADQALYMSKENGRDRATLYDRQAVEAHRLAAREKPAQATIETQTRVIELEALVDQRNRDLKILREYDELTGVPKKDLFVNALEREMKRSRRFNSSIGILSVEIRNLNRIIGSFGHTACDQLVRDFVTRLQDGLRSSDLVAVIDDEYSVSRMAGNEYGVLLTDLEQSNQVLPVITRLRRLLVAPFEIDGDRIHLGASIGISLYSGDEETASQLVEQAMQARQLAAATNEKVSHSFATDHLDAMSRNYIALESDLYEAVERGEIELHFQPKFDVARRLVSGLEVLARWNHQERGYISPADFIPIAENNGLIHDIFALVLDKTLRQLNTWRNQGLVPIRVSINISPSQLREPMLVSNILTAISAANVPAAQIEIELTETSIIESPQRARIVLGQLRHAGLSVSMDDFGTGYTSLALLAELPLDAVKIDRSFIIAMSESERSRTIVESVISMAQTLKLWVVAEGVETEEQLAILTRLGCNEIQGFLISRPLPANEIQHTFLKRAS